jgi:hypothetical protein
MHASLIRVARSVLVAAALTLSLVAPAAAKEPIDPNTLNPPPPAEFNPTCERLGGGIVCDLAFSDPPLFDEPSGILCDGTEILFSQTRSVVGKRYYDADGNLLKRQFREDLAGTYTNPSTGQVIGWETHATNIQVLSVPGDIASGTSSGAGAGRWFELGGATVLVDAGRLVFGPTGILESHGMHHFDDYFERGDLDALQPICDALA